MSDAAPYQRKFIEAVNWPWSRSSWFTCKQGSAGVLLQPNCKATSTSRNGWFSSNTPTRQDNMECRYVRRTMPRTTLVRCGSWWSKVQEEQKRHLTDERTSARTGVAGWVWIGGYTGRRQSRRRQNRRRIWSWTSSVGTTKANSGVDEKLYVPKY